MKKIELMHSLFGRSCGTCGDCGHCIKYIGNRTYYKCDVYGASHSEATDWRKSFKACGLFNKFTAYENVYKLAKAERSEIADGQLSLFEVRKEE